MNYMINKKNKLINEKSQYLLQHASNPVDWYPWCEEAFEKAKIDDKPIFLSIGYSTCHWCHVMEKESFEDKEVADLMNDVFVSIKVDREERPDIDGIYMKVCQMITGSGGWPLTVIMTPDKKPFFVGTYFPKTQKFNRVGLIELIPKIKEIWSNKRYDVLQSANEITNQLHQITIRKSDGKLDQYIFDSAYSQYKKSFDSKYGGFGDAPKFPSPHNIIFLMRYYYYQNSHDAIEMVEKTLTEMRLGGIYDHIGFGFCRYSTDKFWLVPHFEKMLYDQAMLLLAYTEAFQITNNFLFQQTSEEIINYIQGKLTSSGGGFFSAEDADSEGEEGKFYLWTEQELEEFLPKDLYKTFINIFSVEKFGNYQNESKGVRTANNILHLKKTIKTLSQELNYSYEILAEQIEKSRQILFQKRETRIHPLRDEKILTDWNSLLISALVKAYNVFKKDDYLTCAVNAYEFIQNNLIGNENLLYHRYKDGETKVDGNLDDYSFFIQANLDLFESTAEPKYLSTAIKLNDVLMDNFWDEDQGGYFFTSKLSEKLITRQKELYDGAIPSGNSVQLLNLIRLYRITHNPQIEEAIEKQINFFSGEVLRYPSAYAFFLSALTVYHNPSIEIIICGDDKEVAIARQKINSQYIPNKTLISLSSKNYHQIVGLLPHLQNYKPHKDLKIFVCNNFVCKYPLNNVEEFFVEFKKNQRRDF